MATLIDTPILCFDFQTTATHPNQGGVIEIGWTVGTVAKPGPVLTQLVSLPPGEHLSSRVAELTGITDEELLSGTPCPEAWRRFLEEARGAALAVAHYAQFEKAFLKSLETETGQPFPLELVCTQKLARRALPGLPAWGLRAVAGHLGNSLPEIKRAALHVEATWYIWRELCARLATQDVTTVEELRAWGEAPKPARPKSHTYLVERAARLNLARVPGIYRMRASDGRVLYVGKATSLKDRVNSYFRSKSVKRELLAQVANVEVVEVETPLEAALLETDEIKRWSPQYNVSLRPRSPHLDYLSRDYREFSSTPDERHPNGPFRSRRDWVQLEAFLNLDHEGCREELFPGLESEEILEQGVRRVLDVSSLDESIASLLSFGRRLWHRVPEEKGSGTEDAEEEEEDVWTPERVERKVQRLLTRAARHHLRARWCSKVTEATIAWQVKGGRLRFLRVEGGHIVERGYLEPGAPLPLPPAWRRSRVERQRGIDAATYDRMNVLLSGVRALVKSSPEVRVRLSPGVELTRPRLARWLL